MRTRSIRHQVGGKVRDAVNAVIPALPLTRPHGIDISRYQLSFNPPPNPPYPIDFAIQRLNYGTTHDSKLAELWEGVQKIDIRGAYAYHVSYQDWHDQAELLLELAGDKYHFIAWDFENYGNTKSAQFATDAWLAYEHLRSNFDGHVLLYTNPNIYRHWLLPYLEEDTLRTAEWWWAQWYFIPSPFKEPSVPLPATIWQYEVSPKGHQYGVESYGIDLNVFMGGDMHAWLGLTPALTLEERVEILEAKVECLEQET